MLTREEWNFVQKAWDSLKPMGERMQELERRLTGLPPQMVKVTPFKVALDDGTEMDLDGGYFPIVMDPRFSERAIQQDAQQTAQNAMQSGYVRATTSKGYTKERTGFGGPLLLDYEQVLTSHVAKVAKDLSHREFMLASQRFLLDTEVRKTLRETLGPAYEQQFMPWLRTIINDNNGSVQERLDGLKDGMQKLRGNIVSASLGFNRRPRCCRSRTRRACCSTRSRRAWRRPSWICWLIRREFAGDQGPVAERDALPRRQSRPRHPRGAAGTRLIKAATPARLRWRRVRARDDGSPALAHTLEGSLPGFARQVCGSADRGGAEEGSA
jgi:hypothetical protein